MKKIIIHILFLQSISFFLFPPASAQIKENLISKDSLDIIFSNVVNENDPGTAILILDDQNNVLYKKGFGYADIERGRKADNKTQFNIASISKSFTALAIMQLVEKGKLSVLDTVGKFFPGFPKGDKITIHQLLTHTSGISDSANYNRWGESAGFKAMDNSANEESYYQQFLLTSMEGYLNTDGIFEILRTQPGFSFEPGAEGQWEYCNRGYNLLAKIIEKVSGQRFENYMRENIFIPIGMKNTFVHTGLNQRDTNISNFAASYVPTDNGWLKVYDLIPGGAGDGNIYTTLDDWILYEKCLNGDMPNIISKNSLNEIFKKQVKSKLLPQDSYYGYGWIISEDENGNSYISHTGGNIGVHCFRNKMTGQKMTIVILSTTTSFTSILPAFWQYIDRNSHE